MYSLVKELLWLQQLCSELYINIKYPCKIQCDNKAAIQLGEKDIYHERTKHINICYHAIREKVKDGTMELAWIQTQQQIADIFTKPLNKQIFQRLRQQICE